MSSMFWSSVIESYYKLRDFLILLSNHNPASIMLLELYIYPKWGLDSDMYVYINSLYFDKWGRADLIMIPPIEWPINDNLKVLLFAHSFIKFITS